MTSDSMPWLRHIIHDISSCQQVPLWGFCPLFPWQKVQERLQQELENTSFSFLPSTCTLTQPEEFLTPFGRKPRTVCFQLSPLPGHVFWVISSETLSQLVALSLEKTAQNGIDDEQFQEGFYYFLLLQICDQITKEKTYNSLQIQWIEEQDLPTHACLTVDVPFQICEHTLMGRFIVSSPLHKAFSSHFPPMPVTQSLSPISSQIDASLSLEIGSCSLAPSEWNGVQPGDFLLLDRCSYDPVTQSGTGTLSLEQTPCFIVKFKQHNIKILDYATYQGEVDNMKEIEGSDFEEEIPLPSPEEDKEDEDSSQEQEMDNEESAAETSSPP
ncbi:MAG: hypothetical protein FJZ58_08550, partial [Chlamydiae bacterium]|nr:hypothetical protein [Chlamydiota bacterium]